jgi:hypothetical protein
MLADPDINCCVVDYSCPDETAEWLENRYPDELATGRLLIERVTGETGFNKCRAHNAGARRAIRAGAEYLCFLDADTLVRPGFHAWLKRNVKPDSFAIAALREDGSDMPSMTGLLVVPADPFERVAGFDEGFAGWGGEDIELRLRLFLLGGLDHHDVPLSLVSPLPHDNSLRAAFYDEPNIFESNAANMARVRHKLTREWQGRMVRSPEDAGRLWYQRTAGGNRRGSSRETAATTADDAEAAFDGRPGRLAALAMMRRG